MFTRNITSNITASIPHIPPVLRRPTYDPAADPALPKFSRLKISESKPSMKSVTFNEQVKLIEISPVWDKSLSYHIDDFRKFDREVSKGDD